MNFNAGMVSAGIIGVGHVSVMRELTNVCLSVMAPRHQARVRAGAQVEDRSVASPLANALISKPRLQSDHQQSTDIGLAHLLEPINGAATCARCGLLLRTDCAFGKYIRSRVRYPNDLNSPSCQVHGTLFKIPREMLETIPVFRDVFLLPSPEGQPSEGSSDDNPLELKGVEGSEFRWFLRYMMPG
jgi:hypothetical protein